MSARRPTTGMPDLVIYDCDGTLIDTETLYGEVSLAACHALGLLPDAIKLTRDQVTLLESDNVVSAAAVAEGRSFEGLGIAPVSVEAIVPSYLWRFRKTGQFDTARAE